MLQKMLRSCVLLYKAPWRNTFNKSLVLKQLYNKYISIKNTQR